jgi:hypothetical protein
MPEKRKYPYQGREVDGQSVSFQTQGEQWSMYELEDGSTLKIKVVLMEVVRLDEYADNGDPVYLLTAQQVMGVVPNPELKKKAN